MSDVLSRILQGALGGGAAGGGAPGGGLSGGSSPLGEPRLPSAEAGRYGGQRGPMPQQGGLEDLLGGVLGGGARGGGLGGGGLGSILGGLLGGMAGGGSGRAAPGGGGLGGLASGLGGVKGMALMALLAYLMHGRGGAAGLSSLTNELRSAGLGDRVDSWVGTGPNAELRPEELARAIPPDAMDELERHTGLGRDEVLSELSRGLPGMVDRLTPRGQLPERDDELDDIDENEVLGQFGLTPGAPYGKTGPGTGGPKY